MCSDLAIFNQKKTVFWFRFAFGFCHYTQQTNNAQIKNRWVRRHYHC